MAKCSNGTFYIKVSSISWNEGGIEKGSKKASETESDNNNNNKSFTKSDRLYPLVSIVLGKRGSDWLPDMI